MSEGRHKPRRLLGDVLAACAAPIAEKLDRVAGWDRLPTRLGMFTLLGLRHRLRARNLYDTRDAPPPPVAASRPEAAPVQISAARTLDGSRTDALDPSMGAAGARFARNAPPVLEDEEARSRPSPDEVSRELLTRDEFFAAESLNLLAAAWVQFEVHDWFMHQTDPSDPSNPPRLRTDPSAKRRCPVFLSDQTHWWDASQLYGARQDFAAAIRDGDAGKVKSGYELLRAMEPFMGTSRQGAGEGRPGTSAAAPNLWIGTALFHILFAKEHNAICDQLHEEYPRWDGELLYDKARLINAAIMAKIHTVEWTPAIVAHPATSRGLQAYWWGLVDRRRFGRLGPDEVLSGIPGSRLSHDGAPYALTEEFVAVYRLHQLIPDDVTVRRVSDGSEMGCWAFEDLAVGFEKPDQPRIRLEDIEQANALYSLGVANPGEITLHNYPAFLQRFRAVDDKRTRDIGALDIQRTRETGVPRYNNFRRLFGLPPASSFHEIANGNPAWASQIRRVYDGRLEDVDFLIGIFAERKPRGFAFSDTAFRVFLLMAARRLRSDRFFTTDYRPEVYTPVGLKRIEEASLVGLLQSHYPELEAALPRANPFQPWPAVAKRA